jgi:hypothetical protein
VSIFFNDKYSIIYTWKGQKKNSLEYKWVSKVRTLARKQKKTQIPMNKEHLNTMQPQEEPTFYE